MSRVSHLREQIDACRPGSDDLALPALAELADAVEQDRAVAEALARSQRFDQAVAAAMHDVSVPAGLADRLLAACERDKPAPASQVAEPTAGRRYSRRNWMIAIGSTAAVLLAGLAAWQFARPARVVSADELSMAVSQWASDGQALAAEWKTPARLPGAYKPPPAIKAPVNRWRSLPLAKGGFAAGGAAIYFTPPGAPRAALFVFSSRAKFSLPATPVAIPTPSGFPGGKAVAWQNPKSGLVYVLFVVEDRGQRLESFLPGVKLA